MSHSPCDAALATAHSSAVAWGVGVSVESRSPKPFGVGMKASGVFCRSGGVVSGGSSSVGRSADECELRDVVLGVTSDSGSVVCSAGDCGWWDVPSDVTGVHTIRASVGNWVLSRDSHNQQSTHTARNTGSHRMAGPGTRIGIDIQQLRGPQWRQC